MGKISFDLCDYKKTQFMIDKIMRMEDIDSINDVIIYVINEENRDSILRNTNTYMEVSKWTKELDGLIEEEINIDIPTEQYILLKEIMDTELIYVETALEYFLIYEMKNYDYNK